MIISHRFKYIYLKTLKTGSTSVELALSRYCGPDDIITPVTWVDEVYRRERGILPRHYVRSPLGLLFGGLVNLHRWEAFAHKDGLWWQLLRVLHAKKFTSHSPASEVKKQLPKEIWDSYYKFTIERDPLDRIISRYYWDAQMGGWSSFDEFFSTSKSDSNFDIYAIDGEVVVDRVIRYDHLSSDLADVCDHLEIPFDGQLPKAKGGVRPPGKHWADLLSPEQIRHVKVAYAREFEVLRSCSDRIH